MASSVRMFFAVAVVTMALGCFSGISHAQEYGDSANSCISKGSQNSLGLYPVENRCSFKVKLYWANGDDAWNVVILPHGKEEIVIKDGHFHYYACDSRYFVVDLDGQVIDKEVDRFACKKP